jgi:hypothetical protein
MIVSGITTTALLRMTTSQQTIWNRTQMHIGVRSAIELLQQEVGQAGRVALPGTATLTQHVDAGVDTVTVSSTAGMFTGELLVIDAGTRSETVVVTGIDAGTNTITVNSQTGSTGFFFEHDDLAPISVYGGFATGIVPPSMPDGSTDTVLKLYGDINGDGRMLYIEYTCDTEGGKLYRNSMPWDAASKPAEGDSQILIPNLLPNPAGAPCFSYQEEAVGGDYFVVNVALTLTVQTQELDPVTKQRQVEAQTLLGVSPRNILSVWELAKLDVTSRIQPTPQNVLNLLP